MAKQQKPDFRTGDKVGLVPDKYTTGLIHTVKSDPVLSGGTWYMAVREDGYAKTKAVRCEDFVLVGHSRLYELQRLFTTRSIKNMKLTTPAIVTGAVLGAALFIGVWSVASYNTLVGSRNGVDKAWSSVETRYQRRYDLIGNLVESVKGAQKQEQTVFGEIAQARSKYAGSSSSDDKAEAASQLERGLGRLLVITESYPDLKSNATVTQLMSDLRGTEDDILTARDGYNDSVNKYNTSIERFPRVIFANMFGFKQKELFKVADEAKAAPKVRF